MPSSFIRAHTSAAATIAAWGEASSQSFFTHAALLAPGAAALHVPGSASHAYSEQVGLQAAGRAGEGCLQCVALSARRRSVGRGQVGRAGGARGGEGGWRGGSARGGESASIGSSGAWGKIEVGAIEREREVLLCQQDTACQRGEQGPQHD